ncbi:hypothetical protein [Haladaptatus sp. DFWS20]|uniref:hypothetical protein n=1 Tax=Haladaptatus sp. DFWS20 TaxID=3403467 RepID=UPI003EBCAE48
MDESDILLTENGIELIGDFRLKHDRDGTETGRFDSEGGNLRLGGNGHDGDLVLSNAANNETIHLDGDAQNIRIKRPTGEKFVELGRHGNLDLGGGGLDGDIVLRDESGEERIHLDAAHGSNTDPAHVRAFVDGRNGNITLGGDGQRGQLFLNDGGALTMRNQTGPTVYLNGNAADLWLGGGGVDGDVVVRDQNGEERVHLNGGIHGNADPAHVRAFIDGQNGLITLGGDGRSGIISLRDRNGQIMTIMPNEIFVPGVGLLIRKIQSLERRIEALERR